MAFRGKNKKSNQRSRKFGTITSRLKPDPVFGPSGGTSLKPDPVFGPSGGTPPGNPSGCPQLQYNLSLSPGIQSGYGWWEANPILETCSVPVQENPYGGGYCPTWWQYEYEDYWEDVPAVPFFIWPWDDNCDESTYGEYQEGTSCVQVVDCDGYGQGNSNAQSETMHNEMCELGCWNCVWCEMHSECISRSMLDSGYCCDEAGNCQGDISSLPSQGYNGEYRDDMPEFGEQGWMQGICFTTCGASDPMDNSWQCGGGCEQGNYVWCDCCDGLPYPGTSSGISCDGGAVEVELWGVTYDSVTTTQILRNNDGLTGPIPPQIGELVNLYALDLQNNQLTGSIPGEIGNLTSLTILLLRNNQLEGNIPSNIGGLYNMALLDLSKNQLTGQIPSTFGNLNSGQLLTLNLGENQLSGPLPASLENIWLNGFETNSGATFPDIWLWDNNLTGDIPHSLCDFLSPEGTGVTQWIISGNSFCWTCGSMTANGPFPPYNPANYTDGIDECGVCNGDGSSCAPCVNDDSTADSYGDTCSTTYSAAAAGGYDSNPQWCGGYDTDDFCSAEQCCVCGGGSTGSGYCPEDYWYMTGRQCNFIWTWDCYYRCSCVCHNATTGDDWSGNTGNCGECTLGLDHTCIGHCEDLCESLN